MNPIVATGGGDGPEDIMGALRVTLNNLNWRRSATKVKKARRDERKKENDKLTVYYRFSYILLMLLVMVLSITQTVVILILMVILVGLVMNQ